MPSRLQPPARIVLRQGVGATCSGCNCLANDDYLLMSADMVFTNRKAAGLC